MISADPAPRRFPAPPLSLDDPAEAMAALRADLVELQATLDGLRLRARLAHSMGFDASALRGAADDLFNLSDIAAEAARAIHDAFPDQVVAEVLP